MRFTTNDPCYPDVELLCHGKVLIPVVIDTENIGFGSVSREHPPAPQTVTLTRGDGGPISPRVVLPTTDWIATTVREIEPGERYELDVVLAPPYPNRSGRARVHIATGVPQMPETFIRVTASFAPRVRLVPDRLTLPITVTKDTEREFRVDWIGVEKFTVTRAGVNVDGLRATVEEKDGRQVVVLHAPAGYRYRPGTFPRVSAYTDDPQMPSISLPIFFTQR